MSACIPGALTTVVPAGRGFITPNLAGSSFGVFRQATDPIGNFVLTLENVVVGSRIHVEQQSSGSTFYDDVAAASTVLINLSAYASGNPNNGLRIKVRKGSAPTYKPFETLVTAIVGSYSTYVSQISDE